MAYRRKQGMTRASTFREEARKKEGEGGDVKRSSSLSNPSSLSPVATQAIRTSSAKSRDTDLLPPASTPRYNLNQETLVVEDGSEHSDPKSGFWGILARKAKAILDEENVPGQIESPVSAPARTSAPHLDSPTVRKNHHHNLSHGHDASRLRKGLRPVSTSFDKALKESPTPVGNKASDILRERESCTPMGNKGADILHEHEVPGIKASDILIERKLQIRRKRNGSDGKGLTPGVSLTPTANSSRQPGGMFSPQIQNHHENQLKASRDVAMATAAKAKLLLRELKTVKADLAFAKERCAQLEEENKFLRRREKGDNRHSTHADDDLIRLQLETLLAEKARLANENSNYARENSHLREIIEYHQLTMQDFVYFDECDEDDNAEESIHQVSNMSVVSPLSPTVDPLSIPDPPPPQICENQDISNHSVQENVDATSPSISPSD